MSRTRLRIVHVVATDAFAGVERHVARLAACQHDAGHDVSVIGSAPTPMAAALGRPEVRCVPATTLTEVVRALGRAGRVDVVNVHMTAAEVAAALSPSLRRVPIVATRHFAARRGSTPAARFFTRLTSRRIAAQIAVSEYVAQNVEGPSTVVISGVPAPSQPPNDVARRRSVLVAQRLEIEKATEVAIEGFVASGLADDGWTLDIAGDGSQRAKLERLAADRGAGAAVRFLGFRMDVDELMAAAGIFLAPRPTEALGLSVLEAMSAALPVVAAAAGGHLETVGTVGGAALFPPGDTRRLAGYLRRLADDAESRAAYGRDLLDVQRARFTVEGQAVATEAVYRSVL